MTFETFKNCELLINPIGFSLQIPALTKDFGGGFESSVLIGKAHGLRRWQLRGDLITDFSDEWLIDGVSGFQYYWNFFQTQWVNGNKPFYIRFMDKTFLVSFTEPVINFEVFTAKLLANEIELKQRKVENMWFDESDASVFEPMMETILPKIYLNADTLAGAVNSNVTTWTDANNIAFTSTATYPTLQTKNSKKVVRFSGSSNPLLAAEDILAKHIFILTSYDSDVFDEFRGLLSDSTSVDCLAGGSGTNAFFNNAIGGTFAYKKNGTVFAESNQQIESGNKLFVISVKKTDGFPFADLQLGQQKTLTARKWRGDLRKVLIYDEVLSTELETRITNWLMYERDI